MPDDACPGFRDIVGQDSPIALLRKVLGTGRVPHAFLLHGPDGIGKATVGRALAAALLCDRSGDESCGRCLACRKVAHGNHPDFYFVTRLPKKSARGGKGQAADLSQFIVVDQIREMTGHAAYGPKEAPHRVFLIDPADRMNIEAQNALLKTLEEPPGRTVLILVSSRPHALLPTVRSRCLSLRFDPVPVDVLARFLESRGIPRSETPTRAALSGGRPGMALELDPEELGQRREELLQDLEALVSSPMALADLQAMTQRLAGKDEDTLLEGLELLQGILRDVARSAAGSESGALLHTDLAGRIRSLAERMGSARSARLVAAIESLRAAMRFNVNRNALADALIAAAAGAPLPGP